MSIFDFFKSREERMAEYNNVVPFPEPKLVPQVVPPAPAPEPKIFYRFGITDDSQRVAFSMGMTEITMNREGCQQMINQLTFFMNQLDEDDE